MESDAPPPEVVSAFPLPPAQYVCKYTDDNVRSQLCPGPPAPPIGDYKVFGCTIKHDDDVIERLSKQGIDQVYPSVFDHKQELRNLNMSIVAQFLDLLYALSHGPSDHAERERRLRQLRTLFINFHHLVNEYRPCQARELIRETLESQKERKKELIERFDQLIQSTPLRTSAEKSLVAVKEGTGTSDQKEKTS